MGHITAILILILGGFTMFSTFVIAEQNYDIPDWYQTGSKIIQNGGQKEKLGMMTLFLEFNS
jgi:hypothetical protein